MSEVRKDQKRSEKDIKYNKRSEKVRKGEKHVRYGQKRSQKVGKIKNVRKNQKLEKIRFFF